MWGIIAGNRRKSLCIFFVMGFFLLALGYLIGQTWWGLKNGGFAGLTISGLIWIIWSVFSYYNGDAVILKITGAKEATRDDYSQLFNIVEEMCIAGSFYFMPRIFVIESSAPNAFATGRDPQHSAIAVTRGLLKMLNRDELQGVIAHEMSHIMNRDIMLLTFAGVLVGAVQIIADIFLRSWRVADSDDFSSSKVQTITAAVAFILAIFAPLITTVLYFAISRSREYLADATAARLTRYPEGLASALEKIGKNAYLPLPANKITAPLFICDPLYNEDSVNWTDTHPPLSKRIRILREMSGGAGYSAYIGAFQKVNAGKTLGISYNQQTAEAVQIRAGNLDLLPGYADSAPALNENVVSPEKNFPVITGNTVNPGRKKAETENKETVLPVNTKPQEYIWKGKSWDRIQCEGCGTSKEISPQFAAEFVLCSKCGRKILVKKQA